MWNKLSGTEGHGIDIDADVSALTDVEVDDSGYKPRFA